MEVKQIAQACERVWDNIAFDIPEAQVSATEMVELACDADRLTTFGYPEEHKAFQQLISEKGVDGAYKAIVAELPYSAYEAGGSVL